LARLDEGLILGEPDGVSLGRSKEAVRVLQHVFELADEFVHKDSRDETFRDRLTNAAYTMGHILRLSDPARALAIYDHALRHTTEVGSKTMQLDEVGLLAGSAYALRRLGRPADARQRLDAAFARLRQLKFYPTQRIVARYEVDVALSALADHEADTGNVGRAIEVYEELLDGIGTSGAKLEVNLADAADLSRIWGSMAVLYRRIGQPDLAAALESRRLKLWRQWDRKLPNNPFVLRQIAAKSFP
jgi:tetratricopeptide (TPR) repeat protein